MISLASVTLLGVFSTQMYASDANPPQDQAALIQPFLGDPKSNLYCTQPDPGQKAQAFECKSKTNPMADPEQKSDEELLKVLDTHNYV
jgi:hypothetical protein